MDTIAIRIMAMQGSSYTMMVFLIMLLSAGIAVALTKFQWKMGRASYLLSIAVFVFLKYVTDLLNLDTPIAIENGYLASLTAAYLGLLVLNGALIGIASAARSMDAHGTRDKWIMGLIPIANLFLLFAKPQEVRKKGFARNLKNTGIVILILIVLMAASISSKIAQNMGPDGRITAQAGSQ